jgi:hypothetical protein
MTKFRILTIAGAAMMFAASATAAGAQPHADRTIEQYNCKDVMRDSGSNRDVAIAFLHGYLLGKSGSSGFNLDVLARQTDDFIERCLSNPEEKAADAMMMVKRK